MQPLQKRPRITYAIQHFDETGVMRAPYLLCKGLVDAGWNVDIITAALPTNAALDRMWTHVTVHKINGATKKIRILNLARKLFKKRKSHIVLTTIWEWHSFSLMLSKLLFGSPYFVRLDTYTYKASTSFWAGLRESIRYGLVLRSANIILAETPKCFEHATRYFKKPQILHVPSCLWLRDLETVEASWQKEEYEPKREHVIFYAGRFVERKNIHHLIAAFARLASEFLDWKLELRGPITSPEYHQLLQQQVRSQGLANRVDFLPTLLGEELYKRYRSTAIYALPSIGEGLPSTIYEAMYFGGAIVASSSGYVAYQLDYGNCGLLHVPGDIDTLTSHLRTLMSSQEEREMYMSKARRRIVEVFTWERYFQVLEERFRELANP